MQETQNTQLIVARLEERFNGFEKLFVRLVDEQERMAGSYEELVRGQQRVTLVEAEIVSLKEGQRLLWKKLDAFGSANEKRSEKWFWEVVRTLFSIGAALVLLHLGAHPL